MKRSKLGEMALLETTRNLKNKRCATCGRQIKDKEDTVKLGPIKAFSEGFVCMECWRATKHIREQVERRPTK